MASVTSESVLGRLVDGRYEIVARVANGGMATVYRAHDRRLDREVALKIMHPHLAEGVDGAAFVSRFRREARASARLSHPGIVSVFDQGVDGESSYLTMEYVDGENLRSVLQAEGGLTVRRALDVVSQLLDALSAAHRAGLVHRDVKPENVLISAEGTVKVTDFGLARAATEVTTSTTGTVLGTVAYLAPEVISTGGCSPATDVYAVGVLLYEMLTGTLPHTGETPIQVAFQHVHTDFPKPSAREEWLGDRVDELVASFTTRDPAQRPPHAGAARAALEALRAGLDDDVLDRRTPAARPDPPADDLEDGTPGTDDSPDRLGPGVDEIPTGFFENVAPQGQPTVHLVEHPTATLASSRQGAPTADRVDAPGRRRRRSLVVLLVMVVVALGGATAWWWTTEGPGAWTTVPTGLVGESHETAAALLRAAELRSQIDERHDDAVPAGDVVATEPGPGDQVRRDGSVTLVVSLGVLMHTVPEELIGQDVDDAAAALGQAGFTVGDPEGRYDDDVDEGVVLDVSVPEGSEQPHDTLVRLTVSDGPAPVAVPGVVGRSAGDAENDLEAVGLVPELGDEEPSVDVPSGHVIRQDPAQGAEARRTDTVVLTLSSGPPEAEVPDVVGMSSGRAAEALEDAGFEVELNRYLGGLLDIVRHQDVDGEAPLGTTVTLTVW